MDLSLVPVDDLIKEIESRTHCFVAEQRGRESVNIRSCMCAKIADLVKEAEQRGFQKGIEKAASLAGTVITTDPSLLANAIRNLKQDS